jgi:hypothetical protein
VNSKCGVGDAVAIEQTFLDHESCSGIPFFSWLKREDDATRNAISMLGEKACSADEHCRVSIVAARMHRAVNL